MWQINIEYYTITGAMPSTPRQPGQTKKEGELPGRKQHHGIWISGEYGFLTYQPGDYSKCSERFGHTN